MGMRGCGPSKRRPGATNMTHHYQIVSTYKLPHLIAIHEYIEDASGRILWQEYTFEVPYVVLPREKAAA